ncbi:MAG: PPC domain-containing protein, partial [Pirellulaceae bacterium]
MTVTATAALAVPNLDTFLRVFDATGRQLAANNDFGGTSDSQITFTAPADGIYYIGVSAASNNTYSPVVLGTAGSGGSTGTYSLTIEVERNFTATLDGGVIQLNGAYDISASAGSSILVDGTAGTTGFPVPIARDATSAEVAQAVQKALADSLAKGSLAAYPLRGDSIDLTGSSVSNSGPFGLTSSRPEDLFSEYSIANPFNRPALRAQNNAIEGLYLDDFIIGMAERGEVVLNASVGTDFVANPAGVTGIQVGPYQLEVRNGENYGIPTDDGQIVLVDAFGVNERLSDGVNLRLVDGSQMADGALMTISDGIRTVTFEFDNTDVGNGVAPGHVAIPFQSSIVDPILGRQPFTAEQMAAAVRDVINSPLVQSMLETTATMVNGDLDGATSDTLVLSGSPTVQIPFSSGEVIVVRGNGDRNRHRDQGQVVIDSTRITNSEGFGIRVASGPRDPVTGAPNPG